MQILLNNWCVVLACRYSPPRVDVIGVSVYSSTDFVHWTYEGMLLQKALYHCPAALVTAKAGLKAECSMITMITNDNVCRQHHRQHSTVLPFITPKRTLGQPEAFFCIHASHIQTSPLTLAASILCCMVAFSVIVIVAAILLLSLFLPSLLLLPLLSITHLLAIATTLVPKRMYDHDLVGIATMSSLLQGWH